VRTLREPPLRDRRVRLHRRWVWQLRRRRPPVAFDSSEVRLRLGPTSKPLRRLRENAATTGFRQSRLI
jgi:hypothetical protein